MRVAQPMDQRLIQKIDQRPDGCWNWTGSISDAGYGRIMVGSRTDGSRRLAYAHRVAFETFVGPIGDGLELDHLCRNRACVNPAHLDPVTPQTNMLRSEAPCAAQAAQTRCKRGHAFDSANTYVNRGKRYCRACHRERQAKWLANKAGA